VQPKPTKFLFSHPTGIFVTIWAHFRFKKVYLECKKPAPGHTRRIERENGTILGQNSRNTVKKRRFYTIFKSFPFREFLGRELPGTRVRHARRPFAHKQLPFPFCNPASNKHKRSPFYEFFAKNVQKFI
jgi:hypothetical protein